MDTDRPKQHQDSDPRFTAWQNEHSNHSTPDTQAAPTLLAQFGLGRAASLPALREHQVEAALHSRAWATRVTAVQAHSQQKSRKAIIPLLTALRDEHPSVRAAAARALSQQGRRVPLQPLLNALRDTDWRVRAAAALTLGRLERRVPSGPLLALLHDSDQSVRVAALSTLGKMRGNIPLEPLKAALNDPEWTVREAALLALKNIGGPAVMGALLAARVDEDMSVRKTAEEILGMQSMNQPGRGPIFPGRHQNSAHIFILTIFSLLSLIPLTLVIVTIPLSVIPPGIGLTTLLIVCTAIILINIATRAR